MAAIPGKTPGASVLTGMNDAMAAAPLHRTTGLRWGQIGMYVCLHSTALLAPRHFSWSGLALMVVLLWVCGGLGISLGWHRLNTHRSFRTYRWLRLLLTTFGCCTWQGGPIEWVGTHRKHHSETDQPHRDPHSPREGLFWAHAGWMLYRLPYNPGQFTKDLQREPEFRLLERFWWVPAWGLLGALYVVGEWCGGLGLSWLLWGGSLRSVLLLHATWLVNSVSHRWGYRNFDTNDDSTNNRWVAYLSFGEGWHNNHHAHQTSAAHGLFRGEYDVTYATVRLLARVGLAWNVIVPALHTAESSTTPPLSAERPSTGSA